MSKQTSKPSAKNAKQAKTAPVKHLLSKAQRSAIARVAAFKAHTHKSFQSERSASEQKAARANYVREQKLFARQHPALAKAA